MADKKEELRQKWPKRSAANHMTDKVPLVTPQNTLADTRKFIEEHVKNLDIIDYVYVVDKNKKFVGVFSIKALYSFPEKTRVEKIYKKSPLVKVMPTDNQEEAAYLSLKNNLSNIPVVDEKNVFLGVITREKILFILHKLHHEELFNISGIHKSHLAIDNILEIPIFQSVKHRIFWLIIGLLGGLLAAQIISSFSQTLEKNLILAAFIPLVVYIADAVGTQLEAFIIRDFVFLKKFNFSRYFARQFVIVFIIALLLGAITTILSLLFYNNFSLSIVIGVAIIAAILSSIFSGLLIPFFFKKLKYDPANGSGPISTIIQDILSVVIYFTLATHLL